MTAEVNKLLNEISAFINAVKSKKSHIEDIMGKLRGNIRIIHDQMEVMTASKRASVPPKMLKNLPDVKERLLSKLRLIVAEEIEELTTHVTNRKNDRFVTLLTYDNDSLFVIVFIRDQLSEFSEELRKTSNKIEKLLAHTKWEEYYHYCIPFSRLFEWTDKSWRYFHLICTNLRIGLTTIIVDDSASCSRFKYVDKFDGVDKEYVFGNDVVEMFQMLKVDLSSRSKISVKSVKQSAAVATG